VRETQRERERERERMRTARKFPFSRAERVARRKKLITATNVDLVPGDAGGRCSRAGDSRITFGHT